MIPEDWFGCDRRSVEMGWMRCDVIEVETQPCESHAEAEAKARLRSGGEMEDFWTGGEPSRET